MVNKYLVIKLITSNMTKFRHYHLLRVQYQRDLAAVSGPQDGGYGCSLCVV